MSPFFKQVPPTGRNGHGSSSPGVLWGKEAVGLQSRLRSRARRRGTTDSGNSGSSGNSVGCHHTQLSNHSHFLNHTPTPHSSVDNLTSTATSWRHTTRPHTFPASCDIFLPAGRQRVQLFVLFEVRPQPPGRARHRGCMGRNSADSSAGLCRHTTTPCATATSRMSCTPPPWIFSRTIWATALFS